MRVRGRSIKPETGKWTMGGEIWSGRVKINQGLEVEDKRRQVEKTGCDEPNHLN